MTGQRTPARKPRLKFLFWITSGKACPVHPSRIRRPSPSPASSMTMSGNGVRAAMQCWRRSILQGRCVLLWLPSPIATIPGCRLGCRLMTGGDHMKRSTDRILTTHAGSLPRPADLITMLQVKETGQLYDLQAFGQRVRTAVAEAVQHQVASHVDIVS